MYAHQVEADFVKDYDDQKKMSYSQMHIAETRRDGFQDMPMTEAS